MYSEFFWSVFSSIRTEFGDLQSKSPYSVRIPENTDQINSEYGYFFAVIDLSKHELKSQTFLLPDIHFTLLVYIAPLKSNNLSGVYMDTKLSPQPLTLEEKQYMEVKR